MESRTAHSADDVILPRAIVIGGMPRSGTNLARRVLGSHSLVAIPPAELGYFAKCASGLSNRQILSDVHFRKRYIPNVDDILDLEGDVVYRHLLARYVAMKGKTIPGEKTPLNEFYYRDIRRCLAGSDLRFVHMVRNPFDVLASYKNAPFRGINRNNEISSLASVARHWVRSAGLAATRTLTEPHVYRMVRFEDLTSDNERTVAGLCTFLGLDLERDRMLNLSDYEGQSDNTSFADEANPHDSDSKIKQLESRKGHLTSDEIALVGSICGELAQALGYEDADFERPPPAEGTRAERSTTSLGWLSRTLLRSRARR